MQHDEPGGAHAAPRVASASTSAAARGPLSSARLDGTLRGAADVIMDGLERAQLPPRQLQLCYHVLRRQYRNRPAVWPAAAAGAGADAWYGWVVIDLRELAARYDDQPPNISNRLIELVKLGVLERGTGEHFRKVRLTLPDGWAPEVFDRAAAKARHTRNGAGLAPSGTYRMTRDGLAGLLPPETDDTLLAAHWAVVGYFQDTFTDTFRNLWVPDLTRLLVDEGYAPAIICAQLAEIASQRKPRWPWKYLLTCIANAPRLSKGIASVKETDDADSTNRRSPAVPGRRALAPAAHAAAQRGHGRYANLLEPDDDDAERERPQRIRAVR